MPIVVPPPSLPRDIKAFAKETFLHMTKDERLSYRRQYVREMESIQAWLAGLDEAMIEKGDIRG